MIRPGLSLVSPGGARGRLSILIFHRVLAQPDALLSSEPDAARFDELCGWLARDWRVLPLDEAVQRLGTGRLPARALAITFDDGYADNHDVALPILKRHRLPATFYIATGFLGGGRMFNDTVIETVRRCAGPSLDASPLGVEGLAALDLADAPRRRAAIGHTLKALKYLPLAERLHKVQQLAEIARVQLPDDLMMRMEQVVALRRAGMQIGAHTRSHPILAKLDRAAATQEILASKRALEQALGEPVGLFAYPNGVPGRDFNDETVEVVRELGFASAVTTGWGAARRSADPLRLPRFSPWDRQRLRFNLRMARNLWAS